jgi:ABC-type multidrug transport system fused ATPase/permease subunit
VQIGIVGRTGSGKSTLLLALYRMFDLDRGHIYVDGVDISTVPLQRLRPSLSIIPQEPVVFSGTVRTNLDPFNEFQDNELWAVIREVRMGDSPACCCLCV